MRCLRIISFTSLLMLATRDAWAEGDIPQMDITWFANQLFWLGISFGLLFIVVSCFITPRIQGILSARETAIDTAIAEAERAKISAESTSGTASSANQEARVKAAEIMAQLQAEIATDASTAISKLTHDIDRKADHASAVLADALTHARAEMNDAVEDLATAMTKKLLGEPVTTISVKP